MNIVKSSKSLRAALGLVATLAVAATTTLAHADASGTTTVNAVEYSSGQLLIQLSTGVNYIGTTGAPAGCTSFNQSVDTLKAWTSMAQSALLSGKRLKVYFTTCSSVPYIQTLDIWN